MMVLWHLRNPAVPAYLLTCNICEVDIGGGQRYWCASCDYDVCIACRAKGGGASHPHPLQLTGGYSPPTGGVSAPVEASHRR